MGFKQGFEKIAWIAPLVGIARAAGGAVARAGAGIARPAFKATRFITRPVTKVIGKTVGVEGPVGAGLVAHGLYSDTKGGYQKSMGGFQR